MEKPSILIVDDEPQILESLYLMLWEDFNVYKASNGWDTLNLIKFINPLSLILIDLHMPGMTGIDLLQKIRDMDKNFPVMVLTGRSSHEWAKICADLNVQDYLEKLVDTEELISKIKKIAGV